MKNTILWKPDRKSVENSQIEQFREYVNSKTGHALKDYFELYAWSVDRISDFWGLFLDYSSILYYGNVLAVVDDDQKMPGAKWFEGISLNYAENLLQRRDGGIAIRFFGEDQVTTELTYRELYSKTCRIASALKNSGVTQGDRVAGFMPNIPETVIAMLAATSLGAVWSSCSPDFGIKGVLDRFSQIEPKIIFAADGYYYNGKRFDSLKKLSGILSSLPSVEKVVVANYASTASLDDLENAVSWDDFEDNSAVEMDFLRLPFDHPLYIMYSSGTTGLPKSIVHSAGGTLIQHMKELKLHTDLRLEDSIFYFTTCGWMMWNWLVSSLAVGSTMVLYDGNPFYPAADRLPKLATDIGLTIFGTSAKYLAALENSGVKPSQISNFPDLKTILSTGSPLSDESFDFVYRDWSSHVLLGSIAGGTDIISCFVLGNPTLPVYRGEIQCRGLGMAVDSFDASGESVTDSRGELVCTKPFPSMPVYFWNDEDGSKYHNAYFDVFKNVWHHGDYIELNSHGGIRMLGRSDATLNPGGVRIGTAEIYRVVELLDQVEDSVVVAQKWNDDERVILFVKLAGQAQLDDSLKVLIRSVIKRECSPRHVPAKIIAIGDIPYTINGKKVEIAINRIIHGEKVTNKDALKNPQSLDLYKNLAELKRE